MHAITTSVLDAWGGWQLTARCRVAGRDVERTITVPDAQDEHHARAARELAVLHGLDGIWHGAPLGRVYVYVQTDGPNGDFAVGSDFEQHDDPHAPWNEEQRCSSR